MKQMPHIEAALQVEGFTANDEGSVSLTEAQLQNLEDHITAQETRITTQESQLTERNNRITALEAEVKALKGVPADESPSVVNAKTGEGQKAENKADDYLAKLDSAKELFDMVS